MVWLTCIPLCQSPHQMSTASLLCLRPATLVPSAVPQHYHIQCTSTDYPLHHMNNRRKRCATFFLLNINSCILNSFIYFRNIKNKQNSHRSPCRAQRETQLPPVSLPCLHASWDAPVCFERCRRFLAFPSRPSVEATPVQKRKALISK